VPTVIFQYIVPGIADGAVYALCAIGLVITYKTSGVFNFAHGAVAAAGAYMFYQFRVRNHMPWPIAFILALIVVTVIGTLFFERIARWMSEAPIVNLVVATVGVLVMIQSLETAHYGANDIPFSEYLPQHSFKLFGAFVQVSDVIITAFVLVVVGAVYFFLERSRLGTSMTAVVDSPDLLGLQGINPDAVRRVAWSIGVAFAAISGEILAPKVYVSVNTLILLVITAYGAAALGFFDSLPYTFLGAMAIGIAINVMAKYQIFSSQHITLSKLPPNVPFIVLFIVLLVVPKRYFPDREKAVFRRPRPIREFSPKVMGPSMVGGVAVLAILPFLTIHDVINRASLDQYTSMLAYAIIFASLALIVWTSGQISLCHLAFAALGAATTGQMLAHSVPYVPALLIGGLVAIPAGIIVSVPALRLSSIYVAVATFGFGILLEQVFFPSHELFGPDEQISVPRPTILGINFSTDRAYYYLTLIVTVLACALILVVRGSRLGRLLRAMSDSPVALDAHGASVNRARVSVFVISAFLAAIGGGMLAGVSQSASGSLGGTYDFTVSLIFVAVLAFCGRRPIASPFLAAFLFYVPSHIYPFFDGTWFVNHQGAIFGVLAIFVAVKGGLGSESLRVGSRASQRSGRGPGMDRIRSAPTGPIQPQPRFGASTARYPEPARGAEVLIGGPASTDTTRRPLAAGRR
jgi:branched-subunit amino acid ABC-type transport system permease component